MSMPPVDVATGWTTVDLFTPDECDAIAGVCADRHWPDIPPELRAWIMDPRWADLAIPFLGPDVRFLREQVVTKPPNAVTEVPWHQDTGYARVTGEFLTFFVALDDISLDNGCLWMVSGSHRRGPLDHVRSGNFLEIAESVGQAGEPVVLAQGRAAVFSSLMLHRSGGNRTGGTRPAWMVQFGRRDVVDPSTGATPEGCPLVAEGGVWLDRPRF